MFHNIARMFFVSLSSEIKITTTVEVIFSAFSENFQLRNFFLKDGTNFMKKRPCIYDWSTSVTLSFCQIYWFAKFAKKNEGKVNFDRGKNDSNIYLVY